MLTSEVAQFLPRGPFDIDEAEARLAGAIHQRVIREQEAPLRHIFLPGLYVREIFLPEGSIAVSFKHLTRHCYVVSSGKATVFMPSGEVQEIEAPHTGITEPGTQRLLLIHKDVVWTTFHVTDLTDLVEIQDAILAPHVNVALRTSDDLLLPQRAPV